ncbi:hypothetical protein T03_4035, partial [Trichinella britovi]
MSENPRTGRFYDTLDALAGAQWFLASTWQADTGRLMSNNKIGRRRHSPPPLGCSSSK